MKYLILFIAFFLLKGEGLYSQVEQPNANEGNRINHCNVDEVHQEMRAINEAFRDHDDALEQGYVKRMKKLNQNIDDYGVRSNVTYTIPVVVHVMHLEGTPLGIDENISKEQIDSAIVHLNDAFRNRNYYSSDGHNPLIPSVDVEIEFCLASSDPNGAPTLGVNRVATSLSNLFRNAPSTMTSNCAFGTNPPTQGFELKGLIQWDPTKYMNIWLVKEICDLPNSNCGVAGFATLASSHGACYDGIVNEARFFGSNLFNSTIHIHEVGHYLNLKHSWSSDCTNNNCLTDGDFVCDTPPDSDPGSIPCENTSDSCTSDSDDTEARNPYRAVALGGLGNQTDNHENYMDYGFTTCSNTFTQGQKDRMRDALTTTRSSLLSSFGCATSEDNFVYFSDPGVGLRESDGTIDVGCMKYHDVNIELSLYKEATSNILINLLPDWENSTSTMGLDLELLSNTIIFNIGEVAKTFTVRVYDDNATDPNESLVIDLEIVSGDVLPATFNQSHEITIIDNDAAPLGNRIVLFSDDFENGDGNWRTSQFSATNKWVIGTNGCCSDNNSFYISNDGGATNSYEVEGGNPWLLSNTDLNAGENNDQLELSFDYSVGGGADGVYGVFTRHFEGNPGPSIDFGNDQKFFGGNCATVNTRVINLSELQGHSSTKLLDEIGFVWYTNNALSSAVNPGFCIDNIELAYKATDIASIVTTSEDAYLGPHSEVYFLSPEGELILRIQNLSSHDYGCTTATISTDGLGAFNGGVGTVFENVNFLNKTYEIIPSNNNPNGMYEVTLYYSETELNAWELTTGKNRNDLFIVKSSVAFESSDASNTNIETHVATPFGTGVSYAYTAQFNNGFSFLGLSDADPSILPITLLDFSGKMDQRLAHLFWTTSSEINNAYFNIEHSSNGIDYKIIGRVEGSGNSSSTKHYSFIHPTPVIGLNYYRLVQFDFGGTSTTHHTITLELNIQGIAEIFPVPVESGRDLNIRYETLEKGIVECSIYNSNGRIVSDLLFSVEPGVNIIPIRKRELISGVYYLKIKQNPFSKIMKFVVLE